MRKIISSYIPFPPISWWAKVISSDILLFDNQENFRKMTARNRYQIAGSNNVILLTIPLESGREQKTTIANIKIYNKDNWQTKHWRSIISAYNRSPFFEYYKPTLANLFEREFEYLIDFNFATFKWVENCLNIKITIQDFSTGEPNATWIDETKETEKFSQKTFIDFPHYYQVFEDRIGFVPDLSILDLLFSEGPNTTNWIKENMYSII